MTDQPLLDWKPPADSRFNGADYVHERDAPRLSEQIGRVYAAMKDGQWRTLEQIADMTGDPTPSVSAQLRHLRKPRFGSHTVDRRHVGQGLYEYRVSA
jgi:alkylated DNA nucleotide flippase Atl1